MSGDVKRARPGAFCDSRSLGHPGVFWRALGGLSETFYSQFMIKDPLANAAGLTMTNGVATTIGIQ